ncbi:MAG TPA: hypothetical protein PLB73_03715, partial [Leptospiraceae bacterium]|nr:hypothetical protein [Leptospiraceae bacterium]
EKTAIRTNIHVQSERAIRDSSNKQPDMSSSLRTKPSRTLGDRQGRDREYVNTIFSVMNNRNR